MRRLYSGLNSWGLAIGVLGMSLGCVVFAYGFDIDMDENAAKVTKSGDPANNSSKKTSLVRTLEHVFLIEEGVTRVVFEGKNLPEPSVKKLSENKILIKLTKTKLAIPSKIMGGNGLVQAIRSSIHPGGTAWIVLDVANAEKWNTEKGEKGFTIAFEANSARVKSTDSEMTSGKNAFASEKGESSGDKRLFSRLIDASLKPVDKGLKVVLTSDGPAKYTVRKLSRPEKLIIRFHGTRLEIQGKSAAFKNLGNEIQQDGLLAIEMRQIGAAFSPITEAILTLAPGTTHQIDRDLNQLVITLLPVVSVEKSGDRKGNINQLVSLDIEGADLSAVVKTLASESNFDVEILSGTLTGVVNEKFKDIPLKTALPLLLSTGNYDFEIQGNTLRFGTKDQLIASKLRMPHVTELMNPAGGMTMDQFNTLVRTMISPSNALETILDTSRNVIILKGTPSDVADYKRAIKDLKLDEGSGGDLITRMVKLNYANYSDIKPILDPYLTPGGRASVLEDVRQKGIVIRESAGNMGVILELVKELDLKLPQVLIESDIIEINDEKDLNLGVNWQADKPGAALVGDPTIHSKFAPLTGGSFAFGTIKSGLNINATINALETRKKGKVISRPRIATTSGVPASINTTETINIKTITNTFQNGVNQTNTTFSPLPLPISLLVNPRISDDGRITTRIVANITSQSGPAESADAPPPTNTQTATTTITTKNGETIVIGGLVREIVQDTVNGIPILSSLPILGALFQGHEKVSRKVELVIFITPTLLED